MDAPQPTEPTLVAPGYAILDESDGTARLLLSGDWIALSLGAVVDRLAADADGRPIQSVEASELGRVDSAGALALLGAVPYPAVWRDTGREDFNRLAHMVGPTADDGQTPRGPRQASLSKSGWRSRKPVARRIETSTSSDD